VENGCGERYSHPLMHQQLRELEQGVYMTMGRER